MPEETEVLGFTQESLTALAAELAREAFESERPPADPSTRAIPPPRDEVGAAEAEPSALATPVAPADADANPQGPPLLPHPLLPHPPLAQAELADASRSVPAVVRTGSAEAPLAPTGDAAGVAQPERTTLKSQEGASPAKAPATAAERRGYLYLTPRRLLTVALIALVFSAGAMTGRWSAHDVTRSWGYADMLFAGILAATVVLALMSVLDTRRSKLAMAGHRQKAS